MTRLAFHLAAVSMAGMIAAVVPASTEPAVHAVPTVGMDDQTAPLAALQMCGARVDIVQKLSDHFNESPMALGIVNQDAVVEVFVSDNGSWTILATGTDGNSCVVSAGEGWQSTTIVAGQDV